MDESGYTGYDLLNKEQPFQATSALQLSEDTAQKLINNYFPCKNVVELKHKKLSKYKSNWKNLIQLQKEILRNHKGFSFVCDKKYLLILRFLDNCVEPFYYDNGVDFFENGQNYALASLLYYTGSTLWGENDFYNLLYFYQRASKTKLDLNIEVLLDHAKSLFRRGELPEVLGPIANRHRKCIDELKTDEHGTDITNVLVFGLVSHLEKYIQYPYKVIHDTSKALTNYNRFFEQLIEIKEEITFKKTQITSIIFPLKIKSVSQIDSKSSFGVQLADILVGGIVEHANTLKYPEKKNEYNQEIITLYGDNGLIHMLPNIDFDEQNEFRKENKSAEFIEFLSRNICEPVSKPDLK